MKSKHLSSRQLGAINKIGDAMIPGDRELARFSATGCVAEVDRILDYMPAQDLSDLKMLLGILSFLPQVLIAFFVWLLEKSLAFPGPVGGLLRLIRIGLRGLITTLYFSDKKVLGVLGYQVGVYTADLQ